MIVFPRRRVRPALPPSLSPCLSVYLALPLALLSRPPLPFVSGSSGKHIHATMLLVKCIVGRRLACYLGFEEDEDVAPASSPKGGRYLAGANPAASEEFSSLLSCLPFKKTKPKHDTCCYGFYYQTRLRFKGREVNPLIC